jgi:hypothetical protein
MPASTTHSLPEGDPIVSGASGTKSQIDVTYAYGAPHQWGPELIRNALQAIGRSTAVRGDEEIIFDFAELPWVDDATGAEFFTVKRRVCNTGPWMDPHKELVPYFTSLGEGGGTRFALPKGLLDAALDGAYGKGSRASILPHSHLLVCTTDPDTGDTYCLGIMGTPTHYSRVRFVAYDSDGAVVDTVQLVKLDQDYYLEADGCALEMTSDALLNDAVRSKGGVSFLLLGPEFTQDYVNGDPRKSENARALQDMLTNRMNTTVPITVTNLTPADPAARKDGRVRGKRIQGRDGTLYAIDLRRLKTYAEWTARAAASGTVELDGHGTIAEWYLLPDGWNLNGSYPTVEAANADFKRTNPKAKSKPIIRQREDKTFGIRSSKDSWLPHDGLGFTEVAFKDEMYPLYPKKDRLIAHRTWGVTDVAVSDRVGIIIRPPVLTTLNGAWGVVQRRSGMRSRP